MTDNPENPAPTKNIENDWKWWAGKSDEFFTDGPFDSREIAISEYSNNWGADDGFHIIEAIQGRLSFSADRMISDQYFENEDIFSVDGAEPVRLKGADEADKELQALLDGWVEKHKSTFVTPTLFLNQRNEEYISGPGHIEQHKKS